MEHGIALYLNFIVSVERSPEASWLLFGRKPAIVPDCFNESSTPADFQKHDCDVPVSSLALASIYPAWGVFSIMNSKNDVFWQFWKNFT